MPASGEPTDEPASWRFQDSALTVALAVLNMGVGLVIQAWLASRFGTGPVADVFQTGIVVPTLTGTVVFASVPTALVPFLVGPRRGESRRVAIGDGVTLVLMAVGGASVLAVSSPLVAEILGSGLAPAQRAGLTDFIRVTAPCLPLATLCAIAQSHLHASHRFGVVGAGGLVNGLGFGMAAAHFADGGLTPFRLGTAVTAGYGLQLVWMARGLPVSQRRRLGTEATGRTLIRPVVLLAAAYALLRLQPVIERAFAGSLGPGTVAHIGYASKIHQAVILLSTFGVGAVAFPVFAAELREGRRQEASRILSRTLDLAVCFSLVACVGGLSTARPAVAMIFARGEFMPSSVSSVSNLFRVSIPTVFFLTLAGPMVSLLYAAQERRRVVIAGTTGLFVGALSSLTLREVWGAYGVVAGSGVGAGASLVIHYLNLRRVLPEWTLDQVWHLYRRRVPTVTLLVVVGMGLLIWNEHRLGSSAVAGTRAGVQLVVSLALIGVASAPLMWTALRRPESSGWADDLVSTTTFTPSDLP